MDLIEVKWQDHCSLDAWTNIDGIDSEMSIAEVVTVGFLVKETKTALYVSSSIDNANRNICQTMCIIKKVVTSRRLFNIDKVQSRKV